MGGVTWKEGSTRQKVHTMFRNRQSVAVRESSDCRSQPAPEAMVSTARRYRPTQGTLEISICAAGLSRILRHYATTPHESSPGPAASSIRETRSTGVVATVIGAVDRWGTSVLGDVANGMSQ